MRPRRGWIAGLVATAIALAAVAVPLPLYVERPSPPETLRGCVRTPDEPRLTGDYLLLTISLYPASTVDAIAGWLERDATVVDRSTIIPPGVDEDTFFDDQTKLFASTADVATVVGMRGAGLDARLDGDGAAITAVLPEGPANGVLFPGDVVTGVGGVAVSSDEELRAALQRQRVGEPIALDVVRDEEHIAVSVTPVEGGEGRAIIGVEPQTLNPRAELPYQVAVDAGDVGGPSAGLTIALTVYDAVAEVDLAAGRRLAITGTITPEGSVGPVGGIALKSIAAEEAGADLFVVPREQMAAAQAPLGAGSSLRVVGVATFEEAREALLSAEPSGSTSQADASPTVLQACAA